MKKAKAENVALKSDLHELLKAQGSVLSTMFEKYFRRREPIIAILPSNTKLSSDVVTFPIKTLARVCVVLSQLVI